MKRYDPDVSPIFDADRVSDTEVLAATLRWMAASRALKRAERRRKYLPLVVGAQLVLVAALAAASSPAYVWLAWLLAVATVAVHPWLERSKTIALTEELRRDTKLLYAAYLAAFRSIRTKGNAATAEECATLMTVATMSKTSLLGKGWRKKPPIPMAREETVVRRMVKLSLEELTNLIHRILTALLQREVLPHLPTETVNIIVDLEHVRVTGKTLIRRAIDYVRGTHRARHTLPYLRISILPDGFASPALPVYITIPRRGEDATRHISTVLETLRKLGLRVKEAYTDADIRSTRLFNLLRRAGVTLVSRWTRNESARRVLTPHLKTRELRALVNLFSDTLERRIRDAENPKPYIQAKRHALRGNLAVLGKSIAYLVTVDGEFREIGRRFEEWMRSLPEAALWEHTQRSKRGETVRLSVGCVLNSTHASTLEALRNPESQRIYFPEQRNPKNTRKRVGDREYSPLVFYSGFAAPIHPREACSRVWELSLVDLGLKRSQIETEIRESGGFTLECRSTNPVFRLMVKAAGEITNLIWRATRVRKAGFETRTTEKTRRGRVLILTERKESGGVEPQPAGVVETGRTVRIQRLVEKPLTKAQFREELLREHVLFLLVGLSTVLSPDPKPPPKPPPGKTEKRRTR